MPTPRLFCGSTSVISAVAPVGAKPALKPCMKRKNKKKETIPNSGYNSVTKPPITIPIIITFFLPMVSESLPEKGRDIIAEIEKSVIINPLWLAPFISVINQFNSGIIKLKLIINSNMETQMIQKFLGYLNFTQQK